MESGAVFPFLIRTPVLLIIVLLLILPGYILEQIEAYDLVEYSTRNTTAEKRKVEMPTDAVVELSRLADSPLALNWFLTNPQSAQGEVDKRSLTSSPISRDELKLI